MVVFEDGIKMTVMERCMEVVSPRAKPDICLAWK